MKMTKRRVKVRDRSRTILNPNRGAELAAEIISLSAGEHMELASALGGFLVLGVLPHNGNEAKRGFVNESLRLIDVSARRALETVGMGSKSSEKLLAVIRGEILRNRKATAAFRAAPRM